MTATITKVLVVAALGTIPLAASAGDVAAGKAKAALCAACHGIDGKTTTTPEYPNLAGQNEKYLVKALKAYKSGGRSDPVMKPMAATLSDADVENVAAYFASLPCK